MASLDTCITCDKPIPEGRQVCHDCEDKINNEEEITMKNDIKNTQYTSTEVDPADKVKFDVKGVYTRFVKNRAPKNSIHECRLLASVEEGIVSISMAKEKGVMLTVRFDEMVELVSEALNKAKEVRNTKGEESDGGN